MAAAAAYRSGSALRDERYACTHDYTRTRKTAHAEIMAPAGAPPWVHDREALWNRVEAREHRKDSQLARVIEIGLPVELSEVQSVELLRDYIAQQFVSKGMIADFCIRRNNSENPHAYILLTLREATPSGFGPKMRQWNRKSNLFEWRSAWAERANVHLARAGHGVRIDHRTLEAQQSELAPGRKMGVGRGRQAEPSLPTHLKERVAERQRIAQENGEMIIADPTVALRALCRQQPTFTHQELVQFLRSRTDPEQLDQALAAVMNCSELVALTSDNSNPLRYTSQDMLEAEKSLIKRVAAMASRRGHGVPPLPPELSHSLTDEHRRTIEYLVGEGDIKALISTAEGDQGAPLSAARQAWESRGWRVVGVGLSRIAAENLQAASGIRSNTLASLELEWKEQPESLTQNDVVVVAGAEMIGLKQLERMLAVADKARSKLVLVGDAPQLQAMGTLSPLRGIIDATAVGAGP
jgi:Ti-type conjugative transfer relaxase TraA